MHIDSNSFYPEHEKQVADIDVEISEQKKFLIDSLMFIRESMDEKLKSLTESSPILETELPIGLLKSIKKYNELVDKNNSGDLTTQQNLAKNKLRFHEIKKALEKFNYDVEKTKLDGLESELSQINNDISQEENKIKSIKKEINTLEKEINKLRASTKNEHKLADEINKKLKFYVTFELVHVHDENGQGFYRIKCNRSLEVRDIDKLSTGEKNIIAFLYFIEKLNEVIEGGRNSQLIIFDDPMNSNDDTMQYVIIEELQKLFSAVEGDDKLVLLTHNCHFYLNVKYTIDNYKKNSFIHLRSNGKNIKIQKLVSKEDDFKTNYEALWKELKFLYESPEVNESMLLNPIRRIIETYSKFNALDKREMLSNVIGAEKLFNVNSHSIDDLEAELNGKDKYAIIDMFKACFFETKAEKHFEKHWTEK